MKVLELLSQKLKYWFVLLSCPIVFSCSSDNSEEMVKILNTIHKENFKKENPFYPEAELVFFDSVVAVTKNDPYKNFIAEYYKANSYLKVGEETKAVALLEKLLPMALTQFQGNADKTMNSLAIANLRLAERQNCVNNHTAESCLIP